MKPEREATCLYCGWASSVMIYELSSGEEIVLGPLDQSVVLLAVILVTMSR